MQKMHKQTNYQKMMPGLQDHCQRRTLNLVIVAAISMPSAAFTSTRCLNISLQGLQLPTITNTSVLLSIFVKLDYFSRVQSINKSYILMWPKTTRTKRGGTVKK